MINTSFPLQEPDAPSTLPKNATINWEDMPDDPCDVEFRPDGVVGWSEHKRTIGWLFLTGFIVIPLLILMQEMIGQSLLSIKWFMVALAIGCALGIFRACQAATDDVRPADARGSSCLSRLAPPQSTDWRRSFESLTG